MRAGVARPHGAGQHRHAHVRFAGSPPPSMLLAAMTEDRQAIRMHVHERDDLRVDGILRLIEAASDTGPMSKVLQRMCRHAATIAHADVVSVYVREHNDAGDDLVLRANVGFPT